MTAITRTGRASGWRSMFGLRSDQASPIGKISSTHSSAILAVVAICCAAFAWTSVGNGQDRSLTIEPMQSTIDPPLASFSNFCQHLPDVEQRLDASTEYSNAFDQDSNISRLMMQSDDSSSLNRLVSSESSGRSERSNAAQTVDWSKVPPITSVPRPGWFTLRPTGPGYYTLMDELNGNLRSKAPPAPFGLTSSNQTPSFDHDFRYLDKADNTYHTWSDSYKRLHPRDDLLFSTGGEMRYRFNNYGNTFLTGKNDKFDLTRLRAYGDLSYRDQYRAFVEMIDARTYDQDLPPGPSDATNTDLLNAFVELKLAEIAGTPLQIRGGRQEIVLGSQRLIASPDFSNTLRTYDGLRGYWHSQKWSVDSFWVRPVIPNANRFDSSDDKRGFSGLFATHRPDASTLIDLYLLNLDDTRTLTRGDTVTLGGRFAGDVDKRLLYDIEAATQVGSSRGRTINAQAATAGLGWHFADAPGNISFWAYYDYATGTRNPETSGVDRTFNQLFPAGHTYFGYIDLVGRQNIRDLNFQLESNPVPWLQLRTQYHIFHLAQATDALYNASAVPIRRDPTGAAGDDVGSEIDLVMNVHLNPHQDVLLGYSKFFAGEFVRATGSSSDADYFYAQYTFRW